MCAFDRQRISISARRITQRAIERIPYLITGKSLPNRNAACLLETITYTHAQTLEARFRHVELTDVDG